MPLNKNYSQKLWRAHSSEDGGFRSPSINDLPSYLPKKRAMGAKRRWLILKEFKKISSESDCRLAGMQTLFKQYFSLYKPRLLIKLVEPLK